MHSDIRRFVMSAAVALVAFTTACARPGERDGSSSNGLGPSALGDSVTLNARPGGGSGGGTGGSTSFTLAMYTDNSMDGLPNWSDTVTFNVSTTVTAVPYVNLACYQNNVLVASGSAGYFDSYPWSWARLMTLSSRSWTSGAADCTATLGYYNNKGTFVVLTSLPFHVNP